MRDDAFLWFYRPTAAVIIWRRKFWIVLLAALIGVGTFYGARIPTESYGSSAVIQVTMQQTAGSPNETLLAANELAAQYAQLATASGVLEAAATSLGVSPRELSHAVSADTVSQLNLVRVNADGDSPSQSRARADAVATALTRSIIRENKRKADAFVLKAAGPLAPGDRQIAALKTDIAKATTELSRATTLNARAAAQSVLTGLQNTLTALTAQQTSSKSSLAVDAALGQPAVSIVSRAGPGSSSHPGPIVYALIGALGGAIVVSQLFVLVDSLRRAQRAIGDREKPHRR